MIYNLTGVPGSGKTLYMVSKIIAELLKLRDVFGNLTPTHIYHNIEGFSNDNMAALLNIDPSVVNTYVHSFKDEALNEEAAVVKDELWAIRFFYAIPRSVKPIYGLDGKVEDYEYEVRQSGCVFIIDEAQNAFSSRDFKQAYSRTLIRYISRHRHYHHTIWWATQDAEQVDISFRRQTESVYFLENLSNWGQKKTAKVSIYEGYIGHQVGVTPLITAKFRYDKKYYCCYKSFTQQGGQLKEGRVTNNVFTNSLGLKVVAVLLILCVIGMIATGGPIKALTHQKHTNGKRTAAEQTPPSKGLAPRGGAVEHTKQMLVGKDFLEYTRTYVSGGVRYYVVDGVAEMENPNYTYKRVSGNGGKK